MSVEKVLHIAESLITAGQRAFVSPELLKAIDGVLNERYGVADWKHDSKTLDLLAKAYYRIRQNFAPDNYEGDVPYLWAAYYVPQNTYKAQYITLQVLRNLETIPEKLHIVDIGSGIGPTVWAIADLLKILKNISVIYDIELPVRSVRITAIEPSLDNINVFQKIRQEYLGDNETYLTIEEPIAVAAGSPGWTKGIGNDDRTIVFFSNMLSELPSDEDRLGILTDSLSHFGPDSIYCIIEPANKQRSRKLRALQSQLMTNHNLCSWGPCGRLHPDEVNPECCGQCWSTARQHLNQSEGMAVIEKKLNELYPNEFTSELSADEFENNRVKWSWAILSGGSEPTLRHVTSDDSSISLSRALEGHQGKIRAEVVGALSSKLFLLCDQTTHGTVQLNTQACPDFRPVIGDIAVIDDYCLDGGGIRATNQTTLVSEHPFLDHVDLESINPNSTEMEKACEFFLHRFWGFENFRSKQFDIIRRALKKQDVIGILPTGTGKSLCFQLPAFLSPGTAIVVSPLRSLMDDQIENLKEKGFDHGGYIAAIHGRMTTDERKNILKLFSAGKLKILYVAPERFRMQSFIKELNTLITYQNISYLIIDEAHCISEWGHDFRASYLTLRQRCSEIGNPPIIALTATASRRVEEDICGLLQINHDEDHVIKSSTLSRPEISLEVLIAERPEAKEEILRNVLSEHHNGTRPIHATIGYNSAADMLEDNAGLVFCCYGKAGRRQDRNFTLNAPYSAEYVAQELLSSWGLQARAYHSKLQDIRQIQVQSDYKKNKFPILSSTKGFGMGIDKPNIDFVIHYVAPGSLEALYQEAGRAGRDNLHAHHLLVYTPPYTEECINDWLENERRPKCARENTFHRCPFDNNRVFCDYGRMAYFIESNLPSTEVIRSRFEKFHAWLRDKPETASFCVPANDQEDKANWCEQILFYFRRHGLVASYMVDYPGNGNGFNTQFIITKTDNFNRINHRDIIDNVVEKYDEIRRRRYFMLEAVWGYAMAQPNQLEDVPAGDRGGHHLNCRRNHLMAYFQEEGLNLQEGCEFCDLCGEIPSGISQRARVVGASEGQRKLFDLYKDVERGEFTKFDVARLKKMFQIAEAENLLDQLRQRTQSSLTEDTLNPTLHFISLSCEYLRTGKYHKGTWKELIEVLINSPNAIADDILSDLSTLTSDILPGISEDVMKLFADVLCGKVDRLHRSYKTLVEEIGKLKSLT